MVQFLKSASFMLIILNPFLIIVYLIKPVQELSGREFKLVLFRAGLISFIVFLLFTILGDTIFTQLIQAEFASFQIFGGIVLLIVGLQFVFAGHAAIEGLRGKPESIANTIAIPIMIGPGSLSASVIIGKSLPLFQAANSILVAVLISIVIMMYLKKAHDFVKPRNEILIEQYTEIAGRITALYVGTLAVEMIMNGMSTWIPKL